MILKVFCTLQFLLQASASAKPDGLTVSTQQGPVRGTFSTENVRRFLGIPYARVARWQPPEPALLRSTTFQANAFGASCVQEFDAFNTQFVVLTRQNGIDVKESEDCLSLNIWAPTVERKQGTAVLLWMYGGASQYGTSNITFYDGTNFVHDNDDITIVTFNYRLNIFGQPNAPQLVSNTTSQNFGLLDLDAAVKWVHDNIKNFGGDPNRITLFGQSAGGTSIDQYVYAHPEDKMVKGIIAQSGTALASTSLDPLPSTLDATPWNTVANAVGCGGEATSAQFDCMKIVPFRTLENAIVSTGVMFNGVVDNINIFSDVAQRAVTGNFSKVPILLGNTAHEADIIVLIVGLLTSGNTTPTLSEMISDVTTAGFSCAAGLTASTRVKNGVPTWRYQYQGIFKDISNRPELRAYHASEIPIVFGTYDRSQATSAEVALSKFMQQAWVTFARDPQHGLTRLGWPRYDPNTNSLAQLGHFLSPTRFTLTKGSLVDFVCPRIDQLTTIGNTLTSFLTS